ncbi:MULTISPECIES: ABC transporter ATP-binding protein [unclassified Treponema]|uniref:ATP-binding cassette domain-containing protein n=1 Tax=unclassified Treponema TaxID=2638727 RepID=UPI0020A405EF|nr:MULTISPECIES: ABC transporter ATP-binding protein [unclassified Treponema]UTC67660.1 ABC transporter ATP-binding protein [Treponema sp. OMZ 789]UTC70388.1 ABC transporter ATP-binding protein [Treponema sp. OMZ 790]UTC73102.1 ABC transporter ATP-binding protein [Treponema sp. OMZ 791]
MKLFFKYCKEIWKENKALVSLIYFFTILLACIEITLPLLFKFFIDKTREGIGGGAFALYIFLYTCCLLAGNFLNVFWYQLLDKAGGIILLRVRNKIFKSIANAPFQKISNTGREKIKNILFNDTMSVFSSLTLFGIRIFSNLLMLSLFLIFISALNPVLGALLLLMSGAGFLISLAARKTIKKNSQNVNTELKKTNALTNYFIDSIELFKTNDLEGYIEEKHEKLLKNFIKIARKNDFIQVFLKNLLTNINMVFTLLALSLVIVLSKNTSTGDLLFLFFISNMIFSFSTQTEQLISSFYANLPAFEHIEEILKLGKKDSEEKFLKWETLQSLAFENFSFCYNQDNDEKPKTAQMPEPLLNNFNMTFYPGDRVRICGKNGSGKSSLLKLLAGLLEASSGSILINGKNIKEYSSQFKKNKILYISQDEFILNETTENYFEVMKTGLTAKDITSFLKTWDFSKTKTDEDLLNFILEDNAKNISGGMRKKLLALKLFARAKEADIILIDEIEAGMDVETVKRYRSERNKLLGSSQEKIIFEIAHTEDEDDFFTRLLKIGSGKDIKLIDCMTTTQF